MPEPSDSDRRKAATLPPDVAATLLIDCVELGYDIRFRCQYCGMERTWSRRDMLGQRLRARLTWSLARIQKAVSCPVRTCGGPMPVLSLLKGGYQDGKHAEPARRRAWLIETLLDAGIAPADVGLAWTPDR